MSRRELCIRAWTSRADMVSLTCILTAEGHVIPLSEEEAAERVRGYASMSSAEDYVLWDAEVQARQYILDYLGVLGELRHVGGWPGVYFTVTFMHGSILRRRKLHAPLSDGRRGWPRLLTHAA